MRIAARTRALAFALVAAAALLVAAPAQASFGLNGFDVAFGEEDGAPAVLAGSHPFAVSGSFGVNYSGEGEAALPDGEFRDATFSQVPGLVGDATAIPRCASADFLVLAGGGNCSGQTQVGTIEVRVNTPDTVNEAPVYNLVPPAGAPARLGFQILGVPIVVDAGIAADPPYRLQLHSVNAHQTLKVFSLRLTVWGVPAAPGHDGERKPCFGHPGQSCPAGLPEKPFLTLPTSCSGPQLSLYRVLSWPIPPSFSTAVDEGSAITHDAAEPPNPQGFVGCGSLNFHPEISAQPTTRAASGPTGLRFGLDVTDQGLTSAAGRAASAIEKAVVTLPRGMTVNPSQAEGLEACSEARLEAETLAAAPGEGCPQASKIGTVEVESPLVDEALSGGLYIAEPYHNLAGDSLIALYMVFENRKLGIIVKQPLRVEPDPASGQLRTTAEDLPQLPFSHFRLRFREGARAPLISPPGCGSFETEAMLYPYSGTAPVTSTSTFQIVSGPSEGPCPLGGAPFHPGFEAGTLSNQAGSYSPFVMHLARGDGEQDMGRFSFVLPPGVIPKLAGIPWCPEAAIAGARSRQGPHGGQAEIDRPSCPATSQIGRTVAAAGVGSQLTYVPGRLYLAGPWHGDPISAVSITPAVAGPFDAGVVVVREALRLNPVTHVGEVDGAASDPIPHILKGIPLNVRDLRVYADRPEFTLNSTSCEPFAALATIWSDGTALQPAGETPAGLGSRYQAAGCAALGFKPKLAIKLKGGTKRGRFPALKAVVTPRPGDANFSSAVVTLPHSAFLEQGHFGTICTRVQFAAGAGNGAACPPASQYGYARAWTPLLAEPLEGPVFLRSSNHNLPDLVVALHGLVDIDLAARIDSKKGGIRSTFADVPDAPVSRFILQMQGGRKGLIVNSTDLCLRPKSHRAKANLSGQNGKLERISPVVRAVKCKKRHRASHRHRARKR